MEVFFILGILKEREFVVDLLGSYYVYKIDECVCLDFFEGFVKEFEMFRVMVWFYYIYVWFVNIL